MFSELFNPPVAKPPKAPKKPSKPKAKAKKDPAPSTAQQPSAPFEHVVETSPEAAEVEMLEYEDIEEEWDVHEEDSDAGSEVNYDATSIDPADADDVLCGSIGSSPGFMTAGVAGLRSVKVEKKRPPGIAVSFDDDSWIQ